MQNPIVSVIIPTFNRVHLLKRAIDSVLAQSFKDFELLIVDDGSTDDTEAMVATIEDPRVRFIKLTHSGFPGKVRNAGVVQSTGALLAFLDSDDCWRPQKLSRQVPLHAVTEGREGELSRARISHTRELWLRSGKEISQHSQKHRREGNIFEDALIKCIIGPSTVILGRALFQKFGGFREDLEIAEDYEIWLRITYTEPVAYIDEPLTKKYAGHGDQLSEKYGLIEPFRIRGLKDLVDRGYFQGEPLKLAKAELSRKCRIYAGGCRKRGKSDEARKYEEEARRYS